MQGEPVHAGQDLAREVEGTALEQKFVPVRSRIVTAVEGVDSGKARLIEDDGVVLVRAADGLDAGEHLRQRQVEGAAVEQLERVVARPSRKGRTGEIFRARGRVAARLGEVRLVSA